MRRARLRLLWLLAFVPAVVSCDVRPPGPSEDDRGKVTFWRIVESALNFSACTDDPTWRGVFQVPIDGTTVSYRVSEDGQTAEALACTSTDPSTCIAVDPPRTFRVAEHQLTSEGEPRPTDVVGIDCEQLSETDWTIIDEGEGMQLAIDTSFNLVGTATACDELDRFYAELGGNGEGIRNCLIQLRARGELQDVR